MPKYKLVLLQDTVTKSITGIFMQPFAIFYFLDLNILLCTLFSNILKFHTYTKLQVQYTVLQRVIFCLPNHFSCLCSSNSAVSEWKNIGNSMYRHSEKINTSLQDTVYTCISQQLTDSGKQRCFVFCNKLSVVTDNTSHPQ